jgi:hypothetical protein
MREIILRELAAYLPYGLKIQGQTHGDIETMTGLNSGAVMINHKTIGWADFHDIKPILRPISQVQENIEHNGENINVFDLMNEYWEVEFNGVTHDFELPFNGFGLITLSAEQLPYNLVQTLLEYHFDVFGLIDDNLAIPVTKDFNPYE